MNLSQDPNLSDFVPAPRRSLDLGPEDEKAIPAVPQSSGAVPSPHVRLPGSHPNVATAQPSSWSRLISFTLINACLTSVALHLSVLLALATITFLTTRPDIVVFTLETAENVAIEPLEDLSIDWTLETPFEAPVQDHNQAPPLEHMTSPEPPALATPEPLMESWVWDDSLKILDDFGDRHLASSETAAPPLAQGSATFFGVNAQDNSIVFLVDRSGSMKGERWNAARAELLTAIDKLMPKQKFFVILFNVTPHPMPCLYATNQPVPATINNKQQVTDWLMEQVSRWGTPPR